MKHFVIIGAAMFSILAAPSISQAQDDVLEDEVVTPKKEKEWFVYGDANIGLSQFSTSDGNETAVSDSMTNAYFRAGAKYKYFGAEVEYGTGLSGIEEDGISLELKNQTSVFGILRWPGENYDGYIRVGYHSTTFEIEANGVDIGLDQPVSGRADIDSDGFAFGLGGTYFFGDNFGLRADITGYNTRDFIDAGYVGGSIGGVVKF